MDFRHLRAFIAVAEESSVTKAAARLHISQPPLSRHIRQLEEELGITLFLRHRQGVKLTEEGHSLLEKAKVLAAAASDFYETAGHTSRNQANRLRVGIGWGLWETVNKVRVASSRQFANITIDASDLLCTDGQSEHLQNRSLDLQISNVTGPTCAARKSRRPCNRRTPARQAGLQRWSPVRAFSRPRC